MPIFKEQVVESRLRYLKKLTGEEIEQLCQDNVIDRNQDGKPWNYSYIVKGIKSMNTTKTVKYKYSKGRTSGRIYGTTFSIQALPNNIRTFLTEGLYQDYDMVNAHFQILLRLCKHHELQHKYIKQYVKDRQGVLEKNECDKHSMIVLLYSDKPKPTTPYLKSLVVEIQAVRHELLQIYNPTSSNVKNPLSSRLCQILLTFENNCLQKVIDHYKLKEVVPMFDGFMCKEDISVDSLKELTGYEWKVKPHENSIEIDEEVLERQSTDYESVKEEFEMGAFLCRQPVCFYRLIDNEWVETNRADMELDTLDLEADGKPFFKQWLKDKDKLKYDKVIWYPKDEKVIDNKFNTFKPFTYKVQEIEPVEGVIELFKTLLSMLTNNIPEQLSLLENYLAHLVQKPWDNPEVCLVFKGLEGSGKDTLLFIMDKLLGNEYVYCEQDINNILGNFNGVRSKKLVLGLNEMSGDKGVKFKEVLKHCITAKTMLINEKYGKQRCEQNFTRFFIFSNSISPIQVAKGLARRFAVFDTSSERCGVQHKQWWCDFYNTMSDPQSLQTIFNYLSSINIEGWVAGKHVDTLTKEKMAVINNNPVYSYLQSVLEHIEEDSIFKPITIKKKQYLYVHWSILRNDFEISDYWTKEVKRDLFMKLILNLDGTNVKRIGSKEALAIEREIVVEQLKLRLVQLESVEDEK